MLIDSHAHLDMKDFKRDFNEVLERALKGGIEKIITVGIDIDSSLAAMEIAEGHDFIFSSIGYHPHNADRAGEHQLKELRDLASEDKVVAWGEIGLDFYHKHSSFQNQIRSFEIQLDMALDSDLPVIIHDREAHKETIDILSKRQKKDHRGDSPRTPPNLERKYVRPLMETVFR